MTDASRLIGASPFSAPTCAGGDVDVASSGAGWIVAPTSGASPLAVASTSASRAFAIRAWNAPARRLSMMPPSRSIAWNSVQARSASPSVSASIAPEPAAGSPTTWRCDFLDQQQLDIARERPGVAVGKPARGRMRHDSD